jgi:hypothetical protein
MPIYSTAINVTLNESMEFEILAPNPEIAYNLTREQAENIFIHQGAANESLSIKVATPIEKPMPISNEVSTGYVSLRELCSADTSTHPAREVMQTNSAYTKLFS